jgi:ribosomal-protein-alanine N-acetyltransferase
MAGSAMTLIALDSGFAEAAAALHRDCGFQPPWSARSFVDLLAMPGAQGRLAIAQSGRDPAERAPAGLVLWRTAADEAEILTIGVIPAWRRRSIGRALLDETASVLRSAGIARLLLEVAAGNAGAIALYRSAGFEIKGIRRGYYDTPAGAIDAFIMENRMI